MEDHSLTTHPDEISLLAPAVPEAFPGASFLYESASDAFRFSPVAAHWFGTSEIPALCAQSRVDFSLLKAHDSEALPRSQLPWMIASTGTHCDPQEFTLRVPGQTPRHVLCCASPYTPAGGTAIVGAQVTLVDISNIRQQAQRLQEEKTQLEIILEGTDAGTWEWDLVTNDIRFHERWAQVLGYTLMQLLPLTIDVWRSLVHPDDLAYSQQVLARHLKRETPHYDMVCRMKHADGCWVWIHYRGRVSKWAADGRALKIVGTHVDVSSVHAAEEGARASQAYMQTLIDASSDVSIIATDTEGVITVFNTGAERLLGYTKEEMVGKLTPQSFHLASEVIARGDALSDAEGKEIRGFDVFVHAARQGRSETRLWTYVTRAGEHRTVSLFVSALLDGHGKIFGFLGMAVDQTAQLAAEEKARLAAQRFAGAFNSTAVGMALVSLEGRWMEVNGALCDMLGYSDEELLATDFQTLTHPDDLQNDLNLLQQLLANDIPHYQMLKRYFRKNGELIRARLWVSLVRDARGEPLHFVSQIQNITDEYLGRQALQSSEARLRGLFDLSPIGISLMDFKTGRVLEANEALITPSGYTRQEFMQKTDRELTPREFAPAMHTAEEQLRAAGRYAPFEKEYIRKDGSRYPVMAQGILMKDSSGRQVIWSLIEDISERKRLDRIKNEFVSTVSHELRTPLTSISGALSLVVAGALGPVDHEVMEMLRIAAASSERLTLLVDDLLDMDKLLAGKMEVKLRDVNLVPLLQDVVAGMRAYALARKVSVELGPVESITLNTDAIRLSQVLTNLISNACKHSRPGGRVEVQMVRGPENAVIFSVIDKGHGIPTEFRSRIFQKFAQVDASDTSEKEGTGLGLAICKELVERLGGVIGFESVEGAGSHFWVRIPRANLQRQASLRAPRILHVEDDIAFAQVVNLHLNTLAEVDIATSLSEAYTLIRQRHYDLLLLELKLPDGNAERLWESVHLAQPGVPIVILSGHEVPRSLATHVAAVLPKDGTTLTRLMSTLTQLFEMKKDRP